MTLVRVFSCFSIVENLWVCLALIAAAICCWILDWGLGLKVSTWAVEGELEWAWLVSSSESFSSFFSLFFSSRLFFLALCLSNFHSPYILCNFSFFSCSLALRYNSNLLGLSANKGSCLSKEGNCLTFDFSKSSFLFS